MTVVKRTLCGDPGDRSETVDDEADVSAMMITARMHFIKNVFMLV